jgi:hypothetical protein
VIGALIATQQKIFLADEPVRKVIKNYGRSLKCETVSKIVANLSEMKIKNEV